MQIRELKEIVELDEEQNFTRYLIYAPNNGFSKHKFEVQKNSKLLIYAAPNSDCNLDFSFNLAGDIVFSVEVLDLARGDTKHKMNFTIKHKEANAKSSFRAHALLDGFAERELYVHTEIMRGAKNCQASESDRLIKLSKDCWNLSIPSVSIHEKDSQCEHAFYSDELNSAKLNFLLSRGLTLDEARFILLKNDIPTPLQDKLRAFLDRRTNYREQPY